MAFPDNILTSDERVVLHLHPHWKALIGPVFWLLVTLGAIGASWVFLTDWSVALRYAVTIVGLALLTALALWPWLQWRTTHYVFTNERVILRQGVLARNGRDIPMGRVNDVSFSHGLVERMLGCGTLTIESAGERGQVVLESLPQVEKTQSVLYELVEADRDQHSFDDEDRASIVRDLRDGSGSPDR